VESLLQGKTALVTGAMSGIGKQTAIGLAKRGATVVLVARDRERGAVRKQEVRRISGSPQVELLVADLSTQRGVAGLAEAFRARWDDLSVLVNGIDARFEQRSVTEDGVERTLATNYLSAFLLTNLLREELRAGAPSRIVNVASRAHRGAHLDFDDLHSERDYSAQRAYAQSKLAMILFTYELASRLDSGVTVNCVEPGAVLTPRGATGLARVGGVLAAPLRRGRRGVRGLLHVATAPDLETVSAECFSPSGAERRTSNESYDPMVAAQLWEASEALAAARVG